MENCNDILVHLLNHSENEVVEFKAAKNNYDVDDLGKYFSALSNEANLREHDFAWIVFGVDNKTHIVTGTNFKEGEQALNRLKQDMSQHTTDNLIFREIVPLFIEGKRVLMFKIPASPRNIVMHWKGIAYARDGESLKPLNQTKRDEIRNQSPIPDWTAQLVPNATIDDLDELALATARVMYKKVHSNIPSQEIDGWSKEDFLSNSNMMRDGQITRAAILLLGKPLSLNKIHPAVAQITWTLQDDEDIVDDYEHFTIPFLLTVDKVLAKIRNKTMRELPGGTLFPDTMKQYDDYTIREALHNAIAHQDYTLQQRIVFVESPGKLYYGNGGSFIPGTIENALEHKGPQLHYRNECLCKGMVHFNMIDTVGRGIKKIYMEQKNRFFPISENVSKGLEPEPKIMDFDILKEIGSGSFSTVYHVRHKKTKAEYAIKAIDKRKKTNEEEKPYFKREVEVMYKIHHPNVVKLYGHFEDNNYCYFIMEYISKGNVYHLFPTDKKKRLTTKVCASIIKDVISAVYFMHNMKPPIIHRDIKPENVLLSEGLVAKLTDFGWSNYIQEDEVRKTVCGTPIYLAPEIWMEKGHDETVDIWCIGVLLFELVTSTVPFQGNDIDTLKENILKVKINWPKDINTDAKNLIMKILKIDPKQRISLEEMLKHPFITKYIPDATQYLIKPEEGVQYKPFLISRDDPKTWVPEKI